MTGIEHTREGKIAVLTDHAADVGIVGLDGGISSVVEVGCHAGVDC